MQDLRDLECLIALARHRHFARAAEACGLSQPAFSMRIRGLEDRLSARIVKRGNRFQGLTPEGEKVLEHAKAIVSQVRALERDVRGTTDEVVGTLTIGVIPTVGAYAVGAARALKARHPGVEVRLESATSLAIQQGVDDGRFDAGLTYTEGVADAYLVSVPLYVETYALLVPEGMDGPEGQETSWDAAAGLPLILLDHGMQNRRIIDQVFRGIGRQPQVVAESNEFMSAVLMAAEGIGATIIPEVLRGHVDGIGGTRTLSLVSPQVEKSVCLVTRRHAPEIPVLTALKAVLIPEV